MTKERPLAFMPDMVRAERAGIKTMTRRILRTRPPEYYEQLTCGIYSPTVIDRYGDEQPGAERFGAFTSDGSWALPCPKGQPGDRLWVKEAWRATSECDHMPPRYMTPAHRLWYEADTPHQDGFGKYRSAMFMCRWMSRTLLEITSVRVERLQDISEADALAEGVYDGMACQCAQPLDFVRSCGNCGGRLVDAIGLYRTLWETINGPGSWALNPWVWAIEFKRIKP